MKETILVVGGAGFIGSLVNKQLQQAGYKTFILDDLSLGDERATLGTPLFKGNFGDKKLLNEIFSSNTIDAVIHFAAFTDVEESVLNPSKYYKNNVLNTLSLLDTMQEFGVKNFLFSSSAAIFGLPTTEKVDEMHPKHPINPYGETKLIIENMLRDYKNAYGIEFCALRYFNAAGADPDLMIKNYRKKETNLIPRVLRTLKKGQGAITIFGTDYDTPDGTCIRDYIHIADLSLAHLLALEKLLTKTASPFYNLGNGEGFSVRDVVSAIKDVTKIPFEVIEGKRRPGDPARLVADARKAKKELGWQPRCPDISTMIEHAWQALKA